MFADWSSNPGNNERTCRERHAVTAPPSVRMNSNSRRRIWIPCDLPRGSCNGGGDIIPGLAAPRDFNPPYDRLGSKTEVVAGTSAAPDNRHVATLRHVRFEMKEAANQGGLTFRGGPALRPVP